jgi:hypothetical protein
MDDASTQQAGVAFGAAIETEITDRRLSRCVAAGVANGQRAGLIVVDGEVFERRAAFRADQLLAVAKIALRGLMRTTQVVNDGLFADVR